MNGYLVQDGLITAVVWGFQGPPPAGTTFVAADPPSAEPGQPPPAPPLSSPAALQAGAARRARVFRKRLAADPLAALITHAREETIP